MSPSILLTALELPMLCRHNRMSPTRAVCMLIKINKNKTRKNKEKQNSIWVWNCLTTCKVYTSISSRFQVVTKMHNLLVRVSHSKSQSAMVKWWGNLTSEVPMFVRQTVVPNCQLLSCSLFVYISGDFKVTSTPGDFYSNLSILMNLFPCWFKKRPLFSPGLSFFCVNINYRNS